MTTNSSNDTGTTTQSNLGTVTSGAWNATIIAGTYGGTGVNNGASLITIGGNVTFSGAHTFTGTLGADTSVTFPSTGTLVNSAVATLSSLTSIGTIGTGVWNGTVIGSTYGGTGVNNGASTITLGGSLTTSGAFATTFTTTNTTSVTLPTSGTLVNTAVTTLSSLTSVGTIGTGVWQGTVVGAAYGGTGVASPTAHGILIGEGASAVTPIVLTAGQHLVGTTASDPVGVVPTSTSGVTLGVGSGAFTIDLPFAITGKNLLLNPNFLIFQRGGTALQSGSTVNLTVAASTSVITLDRWEMVTGANQTCTASQIPGKNYNATFKRNSGQTGTTTIRVCQSLPPEYCENISQQTCTLSFAAKCGATYSATSSALVVNVYTGTGTSFVSGVNGAFTGNATQTTTVTLSTSQATFAFNLSAFASGVTQVAVEFAFTPVGTASGTDSFTLVWTKLEIAPTNTVRNFQTMAEAMLECAPFTRTSFSQGVAIAQASASTAGAVGYTSQIASTTDGYSIFVPFDPPMYAAPTLTFYSPASSNATWRNYTAAADSGTCAINASLSAGTSGVTVKNPQVVGDLAGATMAIHYLATCEVT